MPTRHRRNQNLTTIVLPVALWASGIFGTCATTQGQDWLTQPTPSQIQSAVGAISSAAPAPAVTGAANVTINTGKECCKQNLPELLGLDKLSEGIHGAVKAVVSMPVLHNFGHTVLYPAAGSMGLMAPPVGGALGGAAASGGAAPAAGGAAAAPGAAPAGGAAPPAIAGMPAPGAPKPGAPPAPAPGKVLKGIQASKSAAKGQVTQIALLGHEDATAYPEIIPSILGSLDSPNEPVRYQCLKSLYELGQPKHCTRARFMKTQCHCQQCDTATMQNSVLSQPMVVERLSRLLTDRTALGHPRETSNRVRRLAMKILEAILRPPGPGQLAVKPDPKYAARQSNPTAAQTMASIQRQRQQRQAEAPPQTADQPLANEQPQAIAESEFPEELQPEPPRRFGQLISQSKPVDFQMTQMADHFESIRIAARKILDRTESSTAPHDLLISQAARNYLAASEFGKNPNDHDLQRYQSVVDDCFQAMQQTLKNPELKTQFNLASVLLTNARLQLAVSGDTESINYLTVDSEALRKWDPNSLAAVEAAMVVVDYAGQMARTYGADDSRYLEVYARHARFFALAWPHKKTRATSLLVGAAELCEKHGLKETAAACYRMLEEQFPSHPIAQSSLTRYESRHNSRNQTNPGPVFTHQRFDEIRHASSELETEFAPSDNPQSDQEFEGVTPIAFFEPQDGLGQVPPTPFEVATPVEVGPYAAQPEPQIHPSEAIPQSAPFYDSEYPPEYDSGYADDEFELDYHFTPTPLPRASFLDGLKALNISHEYDGVESGYCAEALCKDYSNIATDITSGALFEMAPAVPQNVFRLRFDMTDHFALPDRAEYLWPAIANGGPSQVESATDMQEIRAYNETAFGQSSAFMEVPLRFLDPVSNGNTAGIGDLIIGSKTTLLDRGDFRLTSVIRSYIPTGLARRGLGHGHLALEPGILGNWRVGCNTWLHGELDFYMPLGADPDAAGEVLTFGVGMTNVLIARPWHNGPDANWALIGSLELVGKSLLDGLQTNTNGTLSPVDQTIINIHPGLRLALGEKFDVGASVAAPVTTSSLYDSQWRLELRWRY